MPKNKAPLLEGPILYKVWNNVLKYLSPNEIYGKNGISLATKELSVVARNYIPTSLAQASLKQIIAYCKQNPSKIPTQLSEGDIFNRLTINHLIEIASFDLSLAQVFLANETLRQNLTGIHLAKLGNKHFDIATQILATPNLAERLDGFDLADLGKAHHDIAIQILATPNLKQQLSDHRLIELGKAHRDIALQLLSNQNILQGILSGYYLAMLGKAHPLVAIEILANQNLRQRLNPWELKVLGETNHEIALSIITCQHFLDAHIGLENIGIAHLDIAKRMLEDTDLTKGWTRDNFVSLGVAHHEVAQTLVEKTSQKSFKFNRHHFCALGSVHLDIAKQILADKKLCRRLDSADLATIGENHYEIAKKIFETPNLLNKLNGPDLVKLSQNHPYLAKQVLNNKTLLTKLNSLDLKNLGNAQHGIAKHILTTPDLLKKLDAQDKTDLTQSVSVLDCMFKVIGQQPVAPLLLLPAYQATKQTGKRPSVESPRPLKRSRTGLYK